MISMKTLTAFAAVSSLALTAAACSKPAEQPPTANAEQKAGAADADMQAVLDKLASLGGKPIESLSPEEARMQPTPADAVKAIMTEKGIAPDATVTTQDVTYPAASGTQKARVYKPAGVAANAPVILYIHGGGWVIADIDVYDSSPRAIAKATGAIVVSVEYRHAPEAKFPAAHDDVNAAYSWILGNAAKWGGDPKNVAIIGESAGGNMAVDVAIAARNGGWTAPKAVVAVYPVADSNLTLPSKLAHTNSKPLNTKMLGWFFTHTLPDPKAAFDPRLNLVGADLKGLPPTTIILAEIDPLRDDGVNLADKLREAGVTVDVKEYAGVTHEFFGMGAVVADAKDAEDYAAGKLKAALAM